MKVAVFFLLELFLVASTTFPGASFPGASFPGASFPGASFPGASVPSSAFPVASVPSSAFPVASVPSSAFPVTPFPGPLVSSSGGGSTSTEEEPPVYQESGVSSLDEDEELEEPQPAPRRFLPKNKRATVILTLKFHPQAILTSSVNSTSSSHRLPHTKSSSVKGPSYRRCIRKMYTTLGITKATKAKARVQKALKTQAKKMPSNGCSPSNYQLLYNVFMCFEICSDV
ncbi:uncharacterized protein [Misgurnus anguillicaudatus]|uniref:uncharacterized protein n=1 Tax=Misgurnus anguillicaudatus TaxID=75329 RepID=UPI003CCF3B43